MHLHPFSSCSVESYLAHVNVCFLLLSIESQAKETLPRVDGYHLWCVSQHRHRSAEVVQGCLKTLFSSLLLGSSSSSTFSIRFIVQEVAHQELFKGSLPLALGLGSAKRKHRQEVLQKGWRKVRRVTHSTSCSTV